MKRSIATLAALGTFAGMALFSAPPAEAQLVQSKCDTNPPRGDINQCVSLSFASQSDGTGYKVRDTTGGSLLVWAKDDVSELEDNPAWNATVRLRKGNGDTIVSVFLVGTQGGDYTKQSGAFDGAKFGEDAYITVDYKWFINVGSDRYGVITMNLPY